MTGTGRTTRTAAGDPVIRNPTATRSVGKNR